MYIDYLKNDYSNIKEQEREEYIARDKKHLAGLIQERITNDIEHIVDRWYELDDIGYIPENEKFLYLLKAIIRLCILHRHCLHYRYCGRGVLSIFDSKIQPY